jgi:hypothetical protein
MKLRFAAMHESVHKTVMPGRAEDVSPRTDIGLVARKHCADRMLWDFDRADVLLALILLQRRL